MITDRDILWNANSIGGDTMQLLGQQFPLAHILLQCMPFLPPRPLSVLWEFHGAIDFNGKCTRSSSEFSEGSFKVIMYGKLLRFNDIYGVSYLTPATNTNAADNHSSYLTERILHSVIGRRKRVHNGVDVQFISSVL